MNKHAFSLVLAAVLLVTLVMPIACAGPAEFTVTGLNISPSTVVKGETTTIEVEIENVGGSAGTYTAILMVDSVAAGTQEVTLEAGARERVSFDYLAETLGTCCVELCGLTGSFAVLKPAELAVSSVTVAPSLVLPGRAASVTARVANTGDVEGALDVMLKVNGLEADSKRVTLAANATEEAAFKVIRDLPGKYEVSVGNSSATLDVPEVGTYRSGAFHYSICYPKGWTPDESSAEAVVMAKLGLGGLAAAVEEVPVDLSADEYCLMTVETMESFMPGFLLISQTPVFEEGSLIGHDVEYEWKQEGIPMAAICRLMKRGGRGFAATALTRQSVFEINRPLLEACLDSFTPPVVATGTYTSTTHGFSLTLPEGWDAAESGALTPVVDIKSAYDDPFVTAEVYVERISQAATAQDYALGQILAAIAAGLNVGIVWQGDVVLGKDTRGYKILFDATYPDEVVRYSITSVIRGSQAFLITVQAAAADYEDLSSDIESLVRSFTLIEPKPFGVSRQSSLFLLEGDIVTLDPARCEGGDSGIVSAIFSGLVRTDKDLEVAPDLARSWEVSDDGLTYVFHLREDAKFHDGRPVTAADFKYSWERACDPNTESRTARTYLGDIVGAKEMLAGEAAELSGVRVIDDTTLEVTIDGPKPYFPGKLTYATCFVVDKANVSRGVNWTDRPNGTGPFKLKEWQKDELLILERNEDYYLTPARLENVVLQLFAGRAMMMYEQGEIDQTNVGLANLEKVLDPGNPLNSELLTATGIDVAYVGFNVTMPPFDDPNVRRAFALALDVDKIIEVSLKGNAERACGFLPPGIPGYNEALQPLEFDPEEAKRLIGESKYGSVEDLPPITFYTLYGLGPSDEAMIGMWQQNLGVTIEVQAVEELEEWMERRHNREFQLFTTGWGADYIDPQNFLEVMFHSESEENSCAYSNPEVDAALERAAVEQDGQLRVQMYQDIEKMVLADLPAVPYFRSWQDHALVKPYVGGFQLFPLQVNIWADIYVEPH